MHHHIIHLWDELESRKSEFLSKLNSWTDAELNFRPEGEWNAIQVIEHIMESEKGVLGYMMKKTSSGWEGIEPSTDEHAANSKALNERLISRSPYKIPAILTEPAGASAYASLAEQWDKIREAYRSFLGNLDPEFYHRQIFNQPIAGRLNLYQTLEFLSNHILHHTYQIEKLRSLQKT
jgi:hypothetical protein